jgi:GTP-binding nuclear protein Ran
VRHRDVRRHIGRDLPQRIHLEVDRKVPAKRVTFHKKNNLRYFEVSAKSNYHFEMPFLSLARQLSVSAPVLLPPEVHVDESLMQQYEQELAHAEQVPLPDDGNEDFLA